MHEWTLHIQQLVCEEEVREHGKLIGIGEKGKERGLPHTYHFLMLLRWMSVSLWVWGNRGRS